MPCMNEGCSYISLCDLWATLHLWHTITMENLNGVDADDADKTMCTPLDT
jgi:hypothetical protein